METVAETDRQTRFTLLAQEVGGPVRRYVVRRAPAAVVDDVVAEVFLVLWRRLEEVPGDGALPWSYAVARRCLANAERSRQRQLRLVERAARLVPPPVGDDPDHAGLHAALATLGELDREVVTLWAWEQLAPREIAEVTGLSPNAVSIRLHRAKRRLSEALRKDPGPAGQTPDEGRRP